MKAKFVAYVPFEDDVEKRGFVSEHQASQVFEGEYRKDGANVPAGARVLEGLLQRANTKNRNNRIYPQHILERETKKLQSMLAESGGILGELDHPETVTINLQKVCQRIDRLGFNNQGIVEGRITLLPELPLGKAAIGIADALNGKLGQSSRGAGTLFKRDDVIMVGEDYSMKTYDAVHDPSTHGARPQQVQESLIREFIEFSRMRPSSQRGNLADLVDRYLGLK